MTPRSLVDSVIASQSERLEMPDLTFAEAMDVFFVSRYTGRVYLDFAEGKPKAVHLPNPILLRVVDTV